MRVLVVDDEAGLLQSLGRSLRFEGYDVTTAASGNEALAAAAAGDFDAIVLDVVMPGVDGIETCRRLRSAGHHTPVLLLTARRMVQDRVRGLDAGADDYLVKPFAPEELLARLRAMSRRQRHFSRDGARTVGPLVLHEPTWTASIDGVDLILTRTEFLLLTALMRNPGEVLSRTRLYQEVWGDDVLDGTSKTLDVYIGYLRKKLEAGGRPRLVHTVRGVGFALRPPPVNCGDTR